MIMKQVEKSNEKSGIAEVYSEYINKSAKREAILHILDYISTKFKKKFKDRRKIIKNDYERIKKLTIEEISYNNVNISVRQNDITDEPVDAIVNPANEYLDNSGGAARAIEDGAATELRKECDVYIQQNGLLKTGSAMVTTAGNLPCKYVIHTVGPRCEKKQEDITKETSQLKKAVKSVLEKCIEKDIKSV